jgi:hypothetical protein
VLPLPASCILQCGGFRRPTTGWRLGEILPLTWRHIDLKAGIIRLEPGTTKNDEGRTFPFRALPALATLVERQGEATDRSRTGDEAHHPVGVPSRRGTHPGLPGRLGYRLHRGGLFRVLPPKPGKTDGEKRPTRLFHDLRRTAVRNLERAGVLRSVAMRLTGHKTESIYRRYAIVNEGDLAQGVAKLATLHEEPGASEGRMIDLAGEVGKLSASPVDNSGRHGMPEEWNSLLRRARYQTYFRSRTPIVGDPAHGGGRRIIGAQFHGCRGGETGHTRRT